MAKGRILVIDDEDIVRISCKRALTPEGYEVDVAASGLEGLELFGRGKYDLVIIDLKMPGIDGMEVLKNIKKDHPAQNVIVMTGYNAPDNITSLSFEGSEFLEKPFTPDTLLEKTNNILRKQTI